jgi:hypothetical protein
MEYKGIEVYELPDGPILVEGDKFWDSEERCIIEITDIKTKVYRGIVGPKGEKGDDHIFYSTDRADMMMEGGRMLDPDEHNPTFISVDEFSEKLGYGTDSRYTPHSNNGLPPLP